MGTDQKATQISRHLPLASDVEIKWELTKLASRRQAKIGQLDLELYAEDLALFALRDLVAGMKSLCRPRSDGETALPGSPDVVQACENARMNRLRAERDERQRQVDDEMRRHRQEHPEEYFSVTELLREMDLGMDRVGKSTSILATTE